MTDKKQILDNLMEHGKTTGKLTTKEITDALEKLDYDVEQMDSFYDSCAANNIEIIDDIITDDSLDMVNPEDDLDQDGVDISLSTDGIAIDDPVKIYLKEIGRVPLLHHRGAGPQRNGFYHVHLRHHWPQQGRYAVSEEPVHRHACLPDPL